MRRVIVESPFAGNVERHSRYARAALRDCLTRGEAPFASHVIYTPAGVLDDRVPAERSLGIARAEQEGRPVEYRQLPAGVWSGRDSAAAELNRDGNVAAEVDRASEAGTDHRLAELTPYVDASELVVVVGEQPSV